MTINDLRDYIKLTEGMGLLKRIDGASWDLEIGGLSELYRRRKSTLFDNISGYPAGYRVFSNIFATEKQQKVLLGLPENTSTLDFVRFFKKKMAEFRPIKPIETKKGPVMENIMEGEEIDVLRFPVPRWHEHDGGRYIGTADSVITQDPDTGWVNLGTHRVMVQEKNLLSCYMSPGRHGRMIFEKYWNKGKAAPVAIICGGAPLIFMVSQVSVPFEVSEYDYAGWLRNSPIEVVKAPYTGLPIPAHAEIAIEGEVPPPSTESRPEGPFGEWTGYYASGTRNEPVVRVKTVLHRNEPILCGVCSGMVPSEVRSNPISSAMLWSQLEQAGVPDIHGVWNMETGGWNLLIAISIKQRFSGHAMQAALAAAGCRQGSYLSRLIIVVDDDIDPTNEDDVWWAVATRCDPETSITILRDTWASVLDPRMEPEKKAARMLSSAKAIIIACRPYHWIKEFPRVVRSSPEFYARLKDKFKNTLQDMSLEDFDRVTRAKVVR